MFDRLNSCMHGSNDLYQIIRSLRRLLNRLKRKTNLRIELLNPNFKTDRLFFGETHRRTLSFNRRFFLGPATRILFLFGWSSPKRSTGWVGRTCKARNWSFDGWFWGWRFTASRRNKRRKKWFGLGCSSLLICVSFLLPNEGVCSFNFVLSVDWVWNGIYHFCMWLDWSLWAASLNLTHKNDFFHESNLTCYVIYICVLRVYIYI